jgi:RNA polymerase sigma-70 factor, ECF subfamily
MHNITDNNNSLLELIQRARNGDVRAFKSLVDQTSPYAFNLAYKTLFDADSAKDVVQESFIRVWKHLDYYKNECKFTTWLYKIVINLCYDKIKSEKRRASIFNRMNDDADFSSAASISIEDIFSGNETIGIIKKISSGLPLKQRTVFILRDLENLSPEEVSQIMNISVGSVKTNLFYARKFISQRLKKLDNNEVHK